MITSFASMSPGTGRRRFYAKTGKRMEGILTAPGVGNNGPGKNWTPFPGPFLPRTVITRTVITVSRLHGAPCRVQWKRIVDVDVEAVKNAMTFP